MPVPGCRGQIGTLLLFDYFPIWIPIMEKSPYDATKIKKLLNSALTEEINDREIFMKGIDYSYYYEQPG